MVNNFLKEKKEKDIWEEEEVQVYSDCSETSFDKYYSNNKPNLNKQSFGNSDDIIDLSKIFSKKKAQTIINN